MFVVIRHHKEMKKDTIIPIIVVENQHEAYLQLLMEAEPLYETHEIVKEDDMHKTFKNTSRSEKIDLFIKSVANL